MAKNVKINGVTYQNVPEVDIPLATGGGTAKFYDTAGATAEAADVLSGKTAFGANGAITGSMPNNGGTGGTTYDFSRAAYMRVSCNLIDGSSAIYVE